MTLPILVEVVTSLTLQLSFIIGTTFFLQQFVDTKNGCRLWTTCFILVLLSLAVAMLLPHQRLLTFPESFSRETVIRYMNWQGIFASVFVVVWFVGVLILSFARVYQYFALLNFISRHCEPLNSEEASHIMRCWVPTDNAPPTMPPLCAIRILISDWVYGPFCWQLHQPIIVLPKYLINESDSVIRDILRHELEHLTTQHPLQHFLQDACSVIFWFHPFVWVAAREAELTREFHCDQVVVTATGKLAEYLRTLAKIATRSGRHSCTGIASQTLGFGNRKSALLRRSDRLILLAESTNKPRQIHFSIACATLITVTLAATQLWMPTNALASHRSGWSPWPRWTASALHVVDINVRDFEPFEARSQWHEWISEPGR